MEEKKSFHKGWYKLDNAAKIFPGQNSAKWSNIFRVTAVLKEPVDPEMLQKALCRVMPRFPCFKVKMKNGFFWHYFAENEKPAPPLCEDIKNPCHRIKFKENDGYLLRVYYLGCRVSVDTYHALCDGYGSTVFLCTLMGEYFRLQGNAIPCNEYVLNPDEPAAPHELEDSFAASADSRAGYKRRDHFCYHPIGTPMPAHTVNITAGTLSFRALHDITAAKGVTVTEYLAAVLIKIHMEKQAAEKRRQKEVSVQVPINLRRTFGSRTLRNFSVCLRTKIDPNLGEYSFDEILRHVALQLRLANDRHDLNALITANLKLERNPLLKVTPLPVKDFGTRISFLITGEQTTTALLTNLGAVTLPEALQARMDRLFLMPGPGIRNAARCGVSTLGDKLVITFCNTFRENDLERAFFTFLVRQGLHVSIESNRT